MPIDMQIILRLGVDPDGCFRNGARVVASEAVGRTAVNDNGWDDDDLPPSGLLTFY